MNKENVIRTAQTAGKLFVRESGTGASPSRKICGYAILFNVPSAVLISNWKYEEREVIDPSAVTKALLDASDIKMTMFHDRQIVLARSNKGRGSLSYRIDREGVYFEFDAPNTQHGDEALELVKRGDISGCSFVFSTYYDEEEYVKRTSKKEDGVEKVTCRVMKITGIYDFTITTDPAYPATAVEARERERREARHKAEQKAAAIREIRERVYGKTQPRRRQPKKVVLSDIRERINRTIP